MVFDRLIARFQGADRDTRLEALLDWSRKLPDPPARLRPVDIANARVHECQTPVFLWVECDGEGGVRIHADVPRESPTVRGFLALLAATLEGASPAEVEAVPDDLLDRLRLTETLGMTRMHGLSAILARVKRMVRDLAPQPGNAG